MRVLVADPISPAGIEILKAGGVEADVRTGLSPAELRTAIEGAEAVIVRSATTIDADTIEAAQDLRVIGRAGVGVDNIDLECASRRGIVVCNAPQSNIVSAAEHSIALLLALARRITQADRSLRAGRWERGALSGTELDGKTLGVVGFGRVGQLVAKRAIGLGMAVIACDPYIGPAAAERLSVRMTDLDSLLEAADAVTLHLLLTDETEGIIGVRELDLMKPEAYLINTARGGLIDEVALAEALTGGRLGGAGIDVFSQEPPAQEHPLRGNDRAILTPHIGASTAEAQERASVMISEAVLSALQGELPGNAVNVPFQGAMPEHHRAYLSLARRLGRLAHALHRGSGDVIAVEVIGAISADASLVRAISVAATVGVIGEFVDDPITYVNALTRAEDRGIQIRTTATSGTTGQHDGVRVIYGDTSVGGTVAAHRGHERITEVWGYDIDLAPSEHMLFLEYEDRPGVIGVIGRRFGDATVNIAGMQVARDKPGGLAVMAMSVDGVVPGDLLEETAAEVAAQDARSLSASRYPRFSA